ncbi:molybdenum cofactor guanylyltransferase MobA [Roseinatronobacter sp. NSM]|uniref:molybdenum cofactor guanylyltransferase MobA n=1 Tax=Roseinatronobacter sp. NSM TaxID=3457785 RepID=UPI004035FE88
MILGVVLAGGQATRMGGGDKGLRHVAGKPLLVHVLDRLTPQVAGVALNANGDPARFASFGVPVRQDSLPDYPGPLAGILAGLDWGAQMGASQIVTVAVDTPFFPHDLVVRLCDAAAGAGMAVAATLQDGVLQRHPTFGLWPVSLRDDLRAAVTGGVRRVSRWVDSHQGGVAQFDSHPFDPFFNINTPQDLIVAEGLAAR